MSLDDLDLESIGPELGPRVNRFRALWTAWGVLAPSGLLDSGLHVAENGRALTETFETLTNARHELDEARIASLDARLDEFETSMRDIASRVPIPELRLTLPRYLASNRAGILALLDLLLGSEPDSDRSSDGRIFAIDYLITLLCGGDKGPGHSIQHDPVTLTPRLEALCAYADSTSDESLADVASEYFAASNLDAEDLRQELQQRGLRSRKAEIGVAFFAPNILRAIATYNAALYDRIAGEIIESGAWGFANSDASNAAASRSSLYESEPFHAIAAAARRRAEDAEAHPTAADRIAWALDFGPLEPVEIKALAGPQVGHRADLLGTAILVGLICRSLAVLSIDLQDMGIAPDEVADDWVAELRAAFQDEINEKLAHHDYKVACALSELKDRFLAAPVEDHLRSQAPSNRASQTPTPKNERRENARELVQAALESNRDAGDRNASWMGNLGRVPWSRITQTASLILALTVGGLFLLNRGKPELTRMGEEQLSSVSIYLTDGRRNDDGRGEAFVGSIDDAWLALPRAEREASAEELVFRLRQQDVRQIMIYDDDRTLRIQAVGSQPVQTL